MKVGKITRQLNITNAVWAADVWTLTTDAVHYLGVGDTFQIETVDEADLLTVTTIAATTGSTIKFSSTNQNLRFVGRIFLNQYGTGATLSQVFSGKGGLTAVNGLIHIVSVGTATATAKLQGSLDGIHWVDHGTATAITAGAQLEIVVTKPYPLMRISFTVAVAAAGGGANTNTIKIFSVNI